MNLRLLSEIRSEDIRSRIPAKQLNISKVRDMSLFTRVLCFHPLSSIIPKR